MYDVTTQKDDLGLYIKLFSPLSGVRLLSWILLQLNILCTSAVQQCYAKNSNSSFTSFPVLNLDIFFTLESFVPIIWRRFRPQSSSMRSLVLNEATDLKSKRCVRSGYDRSIFSPNLIMGHSPTLRNREFKIAAENLAVKSVSRQ